MAVEDRKVPGAFRWGVHVEGELITIAEYDAGMGIHRRPTFADGFEPGDTTAWARP